MADKSANKPLLSVSNALTEAQEIMTEGRAVMNPDEVVLEESTSVRVVQPKTTVDESSLIRGGQPLEVVVRHSKVVSETNSDEEWDEQGYCEARQYQHHQRVRSRHWSESLDGGNHVSMTVVDDGPSRHHRTIRYRLRHCSDGDQGEVGINNRVDDELEVEMDEEEILCFPGLETAKKGSRHLMKKFWEARWKVQHYEFLPDWLQDNEYLKTGHRPPLPSFGACFKSIFSLHTETGNIWTHMFGCVLFIGMAGWFLTRPLEQVQWQEKMVFSFFFLGAIACLGMSFAFHTVSCHSVDVVKLFSKLDYLGISLLIIGSFIPWLFYGFYCKTVPKITYIGMVIVLGLCTVIVSLSDKFSQTGFRPLRAAVFVALGLSGAIPAIHFMITDGVWPLFNEAAFHWLLLMAFLYLIGAFLYATRTPERFFPGKCDLWFQSHQLFHLCVVVAAFVHYHGISEMAVNRLQGGSCPEQEEDHFYLRG